MPSSEGDLLRFAEASFVSVWALEVLLVLKGERRPWTHEALVSKLRASDLVVTNAVEALVTAGLASEEEAGTLYMPVNDQTDEMVNELEALYRSRPNAVRRAIVSTGTKSASAFAEAFRLRKGKDDD